MREHTTFAFEIPGVLEGSGLECITLSAATVAALIAL
jgi:hypothetical protein